MEDLYGTLEIIVFPRDYERFKHLINKDNKVLIKGNAQVNDKEAKLMFQNMWTFEEIQRDMEAENKEAWVCFEDEVEYNTNEKEFLDVLSKYPGRTEVWVQLRKTRGVKRMGNRFMVLADQTFVEKMKEMRGAENVLIREKKK